MAKVMLSRLKWHLIHCIRREQIYWWCENISHCQSLSESYRGILIISSAVKVYTLNKTRALKQEVQMILQVNNLPLKKYSLHSLGLLIPTVDRNNPPTPLVQIGDSLIHLWTLSPKHSKYLKPSTHPMCCCFIPTWTLFSNFSLPTSNHRSSIILPSKSSTCRLDPLVAQLVNLSRC